MPTYQFKCKKCGTIVEKMLRITHTRDHIPTCCGVESAYHIDTPPMIHWVGSEFNNGALQSLATPDKPVIRTQREKNEYMKRHDLVDANDLGPPPTHEDQARTQAKVQESIKAITPSGEVADRMKQQGLMDIVE